MTHFFLLACIGWTLGTRVMGTSQSLRIAIAVVIAPLRLVANAWVPPSFWDKCTKLCGGLLVR